MDPCEALRIRRCNLKEIQPMRTRALNPRSVTMSRKQEALDYHSQGRKGKIEVVATKPCSTARDLANAYTPGVAEPCLEIEKNPEDAYKYTAKGDRKSTRLNSSN